MNRDEAEQIYMARMVGKFHGSNVELAEAILLLHGCPTCGGTGVYAEPDKFGEAKMIGPCQTCNGTGKNE